ncbi:MAG: hypothetical protein ACOWYE_09900 [Desulfatiglandales bacterium]
MNPQRLYLMYPLNSRREALETITRDIQKKIPWDSISKEITPAQMARIFTIVKRAGDRDALLKDLDKLLEKAARSENRERRKMGSSLRVLIKDTLIPTADKNNAAVTMVFDEEELSGGKDEASLQLLKDIFMIIYKTYTYHRNRADWPERRQDACFPH